MFEVDLVANARIGRYDHKIVEGLLGPAQKLVTLLISFELALGVEIKCGGGAKRVGDHRVVDDEFSRNQRVDRLGVSPESRHGGTHRDQDNDEWQSREVW